MENEQKKVLHWVRGNTLSLAIPLEKETITEEERIKEDYIVEDDDVVTVNLVSSSRRYIYAPKSIEGNVVSIEDNGELDLGTYGVEVLISKANGKRLRSFWNYLIKIHNTNDVVLEEWDDFADVSGEILDSAIFFFAKGDPFTYEDFTQEQLDDIKRPALEAANVATQAAQNANDAATNANNAKNAAIIATNLANSATQNANDAANSANAAAISANQAKRNADTATINANNATESALEATSDAISATEDAKRATDKTEEAIEQAQRAAVIGSNPDFIGSDYYVYKYNARLGRYERSNIYVRGENGDKGEKGDKGDKGDAGTTDYNLLENKPTRVSQFDNDADYATESFVNSSIATATATYRGSFNLVTDLGLSVGASTADVSTALATSIPDADNNDYCFVQVPVATDTPTVIARIDRYKHNGSGWLYEYTLNNSGFTAEQWDAINSGITSGDVDKLDALPTSAQLTSLLNGKQDTINDLASIRSGASAGATAYQKPQAGIPESDLSQGVKDKMNEKEVFWATYGQTTAAEIDAAVAAGKQILCVNGGHIHTYAGKDNQYHYFFAIIGNISYRRLQLQISNNGWAFHNIGVQGTANKVISWQATPDNTHYPSEKLVKDSLDAKADLSSMAKWGVVSQTQTWTQASDGGYDYTMSDLQYGWIPQANIDLYEAAGAVFNEQSGYFELNGLVDISYKAMGDIYEAPRTNQLPNGFTRLYQSSRIRTNIPITTNSNFGALQSNGAVSTCNNSNMEVFIVARKNDGTDGYANVTGMNYFAASCSFLKRILGKIYTASSKNSQDFNSAFTACKSLEEIHLYRVGKDISSFGSSPRLRADCIAEMINNCLNETITITLHPTAYARAIADSDVQAALQAHTNVSLASAT